MTTEARPANADLRWLEMMGATQGDAAYAVTTIKTLRAVLAPLLDDPSNAEVFDRYGDAYCVFCGAYGREDRSHVATGEHAPDCPVLRKDELLGRA